MSNTLPTNCKPCPACNSTGNASGHYQVDDGSQQMPKFCPVCKGRGYVRQDVSYLKREAEQIKIEFHEAARTFFQVKAYRLPVKEAFYTYVYYRDRAYEHPLIGPVMAHQWWCEVRKEYSK